MSPRRPLAFALAASFAALGLASPGLARADGGFAEPPPVRVASYDVERPLLDPSFTAQDPHASIVRLLVGPAGKLDAHAAQPGLMVAGEIGRGAAGLRLTGAWLAVGNPRGIAQYTGELTLDFGGRSRLHPILGAGGGVARTSSSTDADHMLDTKHGATLGVGLVRTGLAVRLPFDETDARVALDVSGVFPAIHGADAPQGLTPWAMGSLGVVLGF